MKLAAKYWVAIFLILGFIFKLWFIGLYPQPFGMDQEEYHHVALDFLGQHEYKWAGTYRLWGYSLILAADYKIFGISDVLGWKLLQAGLDCLTGLFVYLLACGLFKNKKAAFAGFLLYLFNPFTTAYVGVRLTEIATVTITAAIFYLLFKFIRKKSLGVLFVLSALLGFLPFVRPGYLFFSVFVLGWLAMRVVRDLRILGVAAVIFLLPFVYNIARNEVYFGQPAILTVDNLFVREFFISLYIGSYDFNNDIPKPVNEIYREYSTPDTEEGRSKMAQKYLSLAVVEVQANPVKFATSRIEKFWLVWQKHFLFTYENPDSPILTKVVFAGNLVLLLLGATGMILWMRKKKEVWFTMLCLFFICYVTILHAFTITAERFSLPAYPLVFLFAGYAIKRIFRST